MVESGVKRKATDLGVGDAKKPKANGSITSFFGAPKTIKSSATVTAERFDKTTWANSLTDEQRELLKLEIDTLDSSWLAYLKDEVTSDSFLKLKKFLAAEKAAGRKFFPPEADIYSWYTPLPTVKAVILGQDPYHNVNQAHGLCFSVRPPTPAPPSLKNIYKALAIDYPSFKPPPNNGGLLTPWAQHGVLMINTCLTVRAHEAQSHANKGWESFTGKVIETVNKHCRSGVVFLAWGSPAAGRVTKVDKERHLVLKSVHPSPLSAHKGFFECGHFKQANEWLKARHGDDGVIEWSLTGPAAQPKKLPVEKEVGETPVIGKEEKAEVAVEAKDVDKDPEPVTEGEDGVKAIVKDSTVTLS
ncbi:MAG: uracil DNA glycosylase [Vezdaea aestivalis]|nr:MAG: uracil DNA glycosylase [Vezdaea aestivalis]